MVTAYRKRLGELPSMRGRSDPRVTPSIRGDFGYVYELSPQRRRRVKSRFSQAYCRALPWAEGPTPWTLNGPALRRRSNRRRPGTGCQVGEDDRQPETRHVLAHRMPPFDDGGPDSVIQPDRNALADQIH